MNYTAFTAIIITLHHLSAVLSLVLAMLVTGLLYWFLIRKGKYRVIALTVTMLTSLVFAALLAEKLFIQSPIGIEIVKVG